MTLQDIELFKTQWRDAVRRGARAGFDIVSYPHQVSLIVDLTFRACLSHIDRVTCLAWLFVSLLSENEGTHLTEYSSCTRLHRLHNFISPLSNKRKDKYGGSL